MSLKIKFLKMLGALDESEKAQVREFFAQEEDSEQEQLPQIPLGENAAVQGGEQSASAAAEPLSEENEGEENQEPLPEENAVAEEEPQLENVAAEENPEEPNIPSMVKGDAALEEESESALVEEKLQQPILDIDGGEMPIDYQSIVDGLNAKNLALEAENTRLKTKVEGAFGFSSKPIAPAKVNRLYDDDTKDIHFKKQ